jgi:hypothetical protein
MERKTTLKKKEHKSTLLAIDHHDAVFLHREAWENQNREWAKQEDAAMVDLCYPESVEGQRIGVAVHCPCRRTFILYL